MNVLQQPVLKLAVAGIQKKNSITANCVVKDNSFQFNILSLAI